MLLLSKVALTAVLAGFAVAHPGEHHDHAAIKRSIDRRELLSEHTHRSISQCVGDLKHRELVERNVARRAQKLHHLREKRGIKSNAQKFRRDLATLEAYEAVDHNRTGFVDYSIHTPESSVFAANTSCVVTPEVTDGPYYVTGEIIRQNVKEPIYCDGVDLHLEVQYIDIETCQPVEGIYVDIWNANATGVYSGISTSGNYAADGYNSTYLRGIQATDSDGVVTFDTIFPGHYQGRATHTHLLAHMNVTVYDNKTINADNNITHIGQLFYNEELRTAVEATYPYNTNTVAVTSNADDMWDIVQADTYYDPFPEYLYLGADVTDGLMAWIQIGVNTTANYIDDEYYAVAASYGADGGVANESGFMSGGAGGNGTMNGTAPSNGTAPATIATAS